MRYFLPVVIVVLLFFSACVGPEELDDGLVKNLPAVVDTKEIFSFGLKANKFTFDEVYNPQLTFVDSIDILVIAFNVSNYSGGDTVSVDIFDENDDKTFEIRIIGNTVTRLHQYASDIRLHRLEINGENITGTINLNISKAGDDVKTPEDNIPVIINQPGHFTYLLSAENHSFSETYSLNLDIANEQLPVYTNLYVSNYQAGSGTINFIDAADSTIYSRSINSDFIEQFQHSVNDFKPKKILVTGNSLSATVDIVIAQ